MSTRCFRYWNKLGFGFLLDSRERKNRKPNKSSRALKAYDKVVICFLYLISK